MKKFLIRGIVGMAVIYLANMAFAKSGIQLEIGMNPITFLTSGTLGFPGVALLYGIVAFQIL